MNFSGLLLGSKLPQNKARIGKFDIIPISEEEAEKHYKHDFRLGTELSNPGVFISPPFKKIYSLHSFHINIDANSVEEGIKIVEKELVKLKVFLMLISKSGRYHSLITKGPKEIYIEDGISYEIDVVNSSGMAEIDKFTVEGVSDNYFNKFDNYYGIDDKTLDRCLVYLTKAWNFRDAIGEAKTIEPMLQNYYLIIEKISEKISSKWKKDNQVNIDRNKINSINSFKNANYSNSELIKEFDNVNKQIREEELKNIKNKIVFTCKKLGVNENIKDEAIEFTSVRHGLSHPRSETNIDKKWITAQNTNKSILAEEISSTFLDAYINYLLNHNGNNQG